ncbi:MAG TPA: heparin lyase I family protein, partial [Pirellulaceae bacterium]
MSDIVRQGSYAARFEVRAGDHAASGERSELSNFLDAEGNPDYSENIPGRVYYYAFSVLPDLNWHPGAAWNILFQFHGPLDAPYAKASPVIALNADSEYSLSLNGGNKQSGVRNLNQSFSFNRYKEDGGKLYPGSWDDFVLEVRFDIGGRGYVNVWRRKHGRGETEFSFIGGASGVDTLMHDDNFVVNGDGRGGTVESKHYWKAGIYRGNPNETTKPTVIYLDGMTRALSFDDATFGAFGDVPGKPPTPVVPPVPGPTRTNVPFAPQTGRFTASFYALPSLGADEGEDAVIGLSPEAASTFADMAVSIRFGTNGIEVR